MLKNNAWWIIYGIHVDELLISIKADTINFSKKYLQNFY